MKILRTSQAPSRILKVHSNVSQATGQSGSRQSQPYSLNKRVAQVVTLYSSPFGQRSICLMNFLLLNCYNSRFVLLYLWIFKFGMLWDLSEKTFTLHWTFGLVLRSSVKNLTPKKVFCAGRPHSNLKSQYYID